MKDDDAKVDRQVSALFTCESCGAEGKVRFRGAGQLGRLHGRLFGGDLDIRRVVALVACQTCGRRNSAAALRRVGMGFLSMILWVLISGGEAAGTTVFMFAALFGAYSELERFTRAFAATFITFTPGTLPEPIETPPRPAKPRKAELPIARVVAVPAPRLIAPPVVMPPPSNDGGPRFLR